MATSYMGNKSWKDISREERLFCAHLYSQILDQELFFIEWLNNNIGTNFNLDIEWEVGYEVCFYRDLLKSREISIRESDTFYPEKRTFDLCLFSEENIVIIEAKVQQGFKTKQIDDMKKDKLYLESITSSNLQIDTLLLASSKFFENYDNHGKADLLSEFSRRINWLDMYHLYADKLFLQADRLYKQ